MQTSVLYQFNWYSHLVLAIWHNDCFIEVVYVNKDMQ